MRASLIILCLASAAHASETTETFDDPRLLPITPYTIPTHHVPGQVLLKVDGLDAPLLHLADRGDARAGAVVAQKVDEIARQTGVQLFYVRALPLGWGLYGVPAVDEDTTEAMGKELTRASPVRAQALNRWMRAFRTPNDEFLTFMWHLDEIEVRGAWDVTIGSTAQRVGVVDSGTFLAHEDLAGKDAGGFDFISDSFIANDGNGRDSNYNDPGDGADCFGTGEVSLDSFHGSHVAGTILANSDNGIGISGINWGARLITARALGRCGGANVDIMEALAWLAGENVSGAGTLRAEDRPSVVNLSLGAPGGCDQFSDDVVAFAAQQGALPVIATGNDGGSVNSPANCPSAIAVAAFGPDGGLTGYSSFGSEVDVVAPGGNQDTGVFEDGVLSFYSNAADPPYTFYQGTSMAAPHVAGVIALMQSIDPGLTRSDVIAIFNASGAASCRDCAGKPVLRADLAVAQVTGIDTSVGGACDNSRCSPGQACVSDVCRVSCGVDGDCAGGEVCTSGGCVVEGGGGVGGGGGGGGGGAGQCDPERGNMDCAFGLGCRDGVCVVGADDGDEIGALCDRDRDCSTGLCDRGVCTVTCDDEDCRDGYDCDEDIIPGGLCRPENCDDEDNDFCEEGWSCSLSPEDFHVCAVGPSNYRLCSHTTVGEGRPWGVVAVAGLLLLFRRRRRYQA